jgi:hypothetical protein
VIAGFEEKIARRVDLLYAIGRTHQDKFSFTGRFFFERDPTERFFGIEQNPGCRLYASEKWRSPSKQAI